MTSTREIPDAGSTLKFQIPPLARVNNPSSVHGIYPYRGKISAIDAQQVVRQLPKDLTVLDPFCGSGTIIYEAMAAGHTAIGVDANPLAVMLTEGKATVPHNLSEAQREFELLEDRLLGPNNNVQDNPASKHFHEQTFEEIMAWSMLFEQMSPYLKACFAGAISLTARGCNDYKWTSSTVGKDIVPKRYIPFSKKFAHKIKKHHYPLLNGSGRVLLGDSRNISAFIPAETVDIIFTSPPYFDCLDYTAYYARIFYAILGLDHLEIRSELIQNFASYESDMKQVLSSLNEVLKPNGMVIFVVGDKSVHGKVINGGNFFENISPWEQTQIIERTYKGTSSQVFDTINKTIRKEQVVVWQKK